MTILIIYSTKYGTTRTIANKIKAKLDNYNTVDMLEVTHAKKVVIAKYDMIIIGGSIYIGSIQRELRNFVTINQPELVKKKLALFICAGGEEQSILENELLNAFPFELWQHAFYKDILGYVITINRLNFIDKIIIKSVKHMDNDVNCIYDEKIDNLISKIKDETK